ncbi:polysaccharide deacetylase family protein [Fulvivirgaceae bacterium BMA10]|uniref:Polysaccharide deacetylase family protein n=1 Tax=Splendidivirga corallicola TaxID=3051826 RepID=A0ABT8KIL8_9BACT|nr:polysaccharide deacetylase family protein [Fulvivirgaceae bacterium BMA10]
MKKNLLILIVIFSFNSSIAQPKISFTFDDGMTSARPGYSFERWNEMILEHLEASDLKAIFFVTGFNKIDEKGKYLLNSWDEKGHKIANHTFSHLNYNSDKTTFQKFQWEFLKTDSIISEYNNYLRLFRFPYLKEGNTRQKIDLFRNFLNEKKYKNGYVTIDASDWYIDSRLVKRLRESRGADLENFKKFYIEHLLERASYYENLSYKLTGRHINHTLLLHHNLAAALFLGDLIKAFKQNGWEVIDADKAYDDPIFDKQPDNVPAGESLIWALIKETGKFDDLLRYPAEDSRYEKDKMDKLGL